MTFLNDFSVYLKPCHTITILSLLIVLRKIGFFVSTPLRFIAQEHGDKFIYDQILADFTFTDGSCVGYERPLSDLLISIWWFTE